jgi:hypothetical protein
MTDSVYADPGSYPRQSAPSAWAWGGNRSREGTGEVPPGATSFVLLLPLSAAGRTGGRCCMPVAVHRPGPIDAQHRGTRVGDGVRWSSCCRGLQHGLIDARIALSHVRGGEARLGSLAAGDPVQFTEPTNRQCHLFERVTEQISAG